MRGEPLTAKLPAAEAWEKMAKLELKRQQLKEETIVELQGVLGQASWDGSWRVIQA